ncbi:MAG: hypothetical protein AVDCRST_MAG08-3171, partial [uncultured Acetobacteraceae bacterium]
CAAPRRRSARRSAKKRASWRSTTCAPASPLCCSSAPNPGAMAHWHEL